MFYFLVFRLLLYLEVFALTLRTLKHRFPCKVHDYSLTQSIESRVKWYIEENLVPQIKDPFYWVPQNKFHDDEIFLLHMLVLRRKIEHSAVNSLTSPRLQFVLRSLSTIHKGMQSIVKAQHIDFQFLTPISFWLGRNIAWLRFTNESDWLSHHRSWCSEVDIERGTTNDDEAREVIAIAADALGGAKKIHNYQVIATASELRKTLPRGSSNDRRAAQTDETFYRAQDDTEEARKKSDNTRATRLNWVAWWGEYGLT